MNNLCKVLLFVKTRLSIGKRLFLGFFALEKIVLSYPHQPIADDPAVSEGREDFLVEEQLFWVTVRRQSLDVHLKRWTFHRASMERCTD